MQRGKTKAVLAGPSTIHVWCTYSFLKLNPKIAMDLVRQFDFGKDASVSGAKSTWRHEVKTSCTPAGVLTVQVIYQSVSMTDEIKATCEQDAESVVLVPLDIVFDANDVPGNEKAPETEKKSDDTKKDDPNKNQGGNRQGGRQDRGGGNQPRGQ